MSLMLFKKAILSSEKEEPDKALNLYKSIKNDYKTSREANGIEKYIAKVENS